MRQLQLVAVSAQLPGSHLDRAYVVVARVVVAGRRSFAIPELHLVVRPTHEPFRFEVWTSHALDGKQRKASTPVGVVAPLTG